MNNLTNNGELNLTDLKYIDVSDDEKEKCVVRKGFFLFCKMYFNFTHTFSDLCAVLLIIFSFYDTINLNTYSTICMQIYNQKLVNE